MGRNSNGKVAMESF